MKKKIKNVVLNIVAKTAFKTAIKACGAASWFDCYQPKEPESLKKISK